MLQRAMSIAALCLLGAGIAAHAEGRLDAVRMQAAEGKTSEALASLESMLRRAPDDVEARLLKGVILAESGRLGQAERAFARLIEDRPELPEPYNNLAVVQAARGDYEGAVETLKKALETSASYRVAYENLTKIFGRLASQAYSRALAVDPPETASGPELAMLAKIVGEPPPPSVQPEETRQAKTAPEPVPTPAKMVAKTPPAEPQPPEPAAVEPPAPAAEPTSPSDSGEGWSAAEDIAATVDAWAAAWAGQRVDDYLAFYAESFEPPDGMSRDAWEGQRRERLAAPEFIRVNVAIQASELSESDRATVTFMQSYESNTFSDLVTKTLDLERVGGQWKIVKETVEQ